MDYSEEYKRVLLGKPHCILGKEGIKEDFIEYVKKILKAHKIIKIKALKSITGKYPIKLIAIKISQATDTNILDIRGRKIILSRI
jgi:RNA-binding protein